MASSQLRVGPAGGPAVDQVSVLTAATSSFSSGSEVHAQVSPQTSKPEALGGVVRSQAFR